MAEILIIDDEKNIRGSLREVLEYEKYKVYEAENGKEGLEKALAKDFDLIICDIKMPLMDGLEFQERLMMRKPQSNLVVISGHGTIETAVEAIKKGAFDYIAKPLDLNRLLVTVRNALDKSVLVEQTNTLKKQIFKSKGTEIIGESPQIMEIKSMIERVAPTDARVLITGENGTGKELVARLLHEKSDRAQAEFVEVNCAAIPSELIESELFGHEKGAFTSAIKQRKGKFEQATDGTLFLDEIGDMSLSAQAKVLRALQENRITRVGGESDIKVFPRVVAATNKNLRDEINNNNFREDLFHRLGVILLHVPPLRERADDIPLLAKHFLGIVCKEQGIKEKKIADSALQELKNQSWKGNIRELRNVIERLVILCAETIEAADVKKYVNPY
jgi:two-component system nitrogen regulation response regulator NtrX